MFSEGKSFLLVILVIFSFTSAAQTSQLDSIKVKIEKYPTAKSQINAYLDAVKHYQDFDNELAYQLSEQALKKAEQANSTKAILQCKILKGGCLISLGRHNLGLALLKNAAEKCDQLNEYAFLAEIYFIRGNLYRELGVTSKMTEDYQRLNDLVQSKNITSHKAKATNALAIIDAINNDLDAAELKFKEILNYESVEKDFQIMMLNNIGNVKRYKGQLDSALYYYNLNYQLAKENNHIKGLVDICINISSIYAIQKKYSEAIKYCDESYEIAKSIPWSDGEAVAAKNLSAIYSAKGDFTMAFKYLNEFQQIRIELLKSDLERNISFLETQFLKEKNKKLKSETELNKLKYQATISAGRRFLWTSIIIGLAVSIILLITIRSLLKKRKKQRSEHETVKTQLEKNRKELTVRTKQISLTYSLLEEMSSTLKVISKENPNSVLVEELNEKMNTIEQKMNREGDWQKFLSTFREAFPGFEKRLSKQFPDLSHNEKMICIYIKSGLSQKEISHLKNISLDGVKTAAKRLKKKLNISNEMRLFDFISTI